MPSRLRLVDGHRVGRRGGLEADAEEHHLLGPGSRWASLQRVERRVDDADVAARALDPEQVLARCRARAACRRTSRRSRPGRAAISSALSMISSGVTQTGQPGPVDHLDLVGQQLVDAVPDDRVGLPAADLHDRPAAGSSTAWIWSSSRAASSGSLNSSRYFTDCLLLAGVRSARLPGRGSNPSPNSSSSMPSCSKLGERLQRRLLVEPLDREADVDDRRTRRPARRGCTPGRPPCGRRRSRPRPSACRRAPRCSMTLPGTARHMALSSCRRRVSRDAPTHQLAEGDAAVVGRHLPVAQHREAAARSRVRGTAASSRAFWNTPPAERDRVEAGRCSRPRAARSTTRSATRGVEPRARSRRPATPARTSATTARDHRRRVDRRHARRPPASSRTRSAAASGRAPRPAPSSSIAAWAS